MQEKDVLACRFIALWPWIMDKYAFDLAVLGMRNVNVCCESDWCSYEIYVCFACWIFIQRWFYQRFPQCSAPVIFSSAPAPLPASSLFKYKPKGLLWKCNLYGKSLFVDKLYKHNLQLEPSGAKLTICFQYSCRICDRRCIYGTQI